MQLDALKKRQLRIGVVALTLGLFVAPAMAGLLMGLGFSVSHTQGLFLLGAILVPGLLSVDVISFFALPLNGLIYAVVAIAVDAAYRKFAKQR